MSVKFALFIDIRVLDEMLTLDFIIANQDRHMGNFGVLRNTDTLEYIGFAPIFDCGTSLRLCTDCEKTEKDADDILYAIKNLASVGRTELEKATKAKQDIAVD